MVGADGAMTKRMNIGVALATAALGAAIAVGGCKSESSKNEASVIPSDLGATCAAPLPLAGRVVQKTFPDGRDFVALSGNPDEAIAEGAIGLVREGTGHALAIQVGGGRTTIPDSTGALGVLGAKLPGTSLNVIVFARARLAPKARFASTHVSEVDGATWSLEVRLLDGGKVIGTRSLPYPGEAITPIDIDTTGIAKTTSVLVQLDKRGVTTRMPGDLRGDPLSMQIVEVSYESGVLDVTIEARESVTEDDFKRLIEGHVAGPLCAPHACGTLLDGLGREKSCGTCDGGRLCVSNVCKLAADVAGGACVPARRDVACGASVGKGAGCGKRYDGCGGVVDCGECSDGLVCGADEPGLCGDPRAIRPSDVRALFAMRVCGCFQGRDEVNLEIACGDKERCDRGVCVPEVNP